MKDGFIRVMTRSPQVRVADVKYNTAQTLLAIDEAVAEQAALLVLPELGISAYSCGDLFLQQSLLDASLSAAKQVAEYTEGKNLAVCFSLPLQKEGALYTVAAVAANGKLLGFVPKSYLPNYGEFYEARAFVPAPDENSTVDFFGQQVPFGSKLLFRCRQLPAFTLGVEICEDMFVACPPSSLHCMAGATVIANLSASSETLGKAQLRRSYATVQGARGKCAYVYVSSGMSESTTSSVCGAHNLIAEGGYILTESAPLGVGKAVADIDVQSLLHSRRRVAHTRDFAEGYDMVEFDLQSVFYEKLRRPIAMRPFVNDDPAHLAENCSTAFGVQSHGLAQRLQKTGIKKVVMGISGGLDSTLALLVAVNTMDMLGRSRKDVIAATIPCFGTSQRTKSNAEKMCELLGVDLRVIDISETVAKHLADIGHDGVTPDTTFENAQARERTQVLMDISNMENGLVLGTGDLSEGALGWCTYNGDHISMYSVNGDMPKTFIRAVVKHIADSWNDEALREVLYDVVATPISPELTPPKDGEIAQKTEDIVGPYDAHDFFIYHFVRNGYSPKKILRLANQAFEGIYTPDQLKGWLRTFIRRFFTSQFKRNCVPDCPKIGSVDLSPYSWRMVSDASSALFLAELDD